MKTKKTSKPKKSIREFISEEDLKFQIYLVKYSGMLKDVRTKDEDVLIKAFNDATNKRLKSIIKEQSTLEDCKENGIIKNALEVNTKYVLKNKPLLDKESILKEYELKKKNYLKYLKDRIKLENRKEDILMLEYAKNLELTENVSKEKFGEMLLLMIKNMATMPSFSGYTENWKTDFFSNAIEKTLLYVHNFDENLISKRTGNKSKAFAYVTQICFNAFKNVINIRKAESAFIKDRISFNTSAVEGVRTQMINESEDSNKDLLESGELRIHISSEDIGLKINSIIKEIKESNDIVTNNKILFGELDHLSSSTPESEKNVDYHDYCTSIAEDIKISKYPNIIKSLIIEKDRGIDLKGIKLSKEDFDISVVSTPLPKIEDEVLEEPQDKNKVNSVKKIKKEETIFNIEDW